MLKELNHLRWSCSNRIALATLIGSLGLLAPARDRGIVDVVPPLGLGIPAIEKVLEARDRCADNGDGTCEYYDSNGNYRGTEIINLQGQIDAQGPPISDIPVQGPPLPSISQ